MISCTGVNPFNLTNSSSLPDTSTFTISTSAAAASAHSISSSIPTTNNPTTSGGGSSAPVGIIVGVVVGVVVAIAVVVAIILLIRWRKGSYPQIKARREEEIL